MDRIGEMTFALRRHLDLACEHAAVLVALAHHRLTPLDPLNQLRERQRALLHDLVHLFSFHARKAIELAGSESAASSLQLASADDIPPPEITDIGIASHTTKDLWWVLNRIVHSHLLSFGEAETVDSAAAWTADPIRSYWTLSVFSVRSDRDEPGAEHWVEVYHLVRAFLTLLPLLEQRAGEPPLGAAV
jgi:hypothetical protein